MDDSATDLKNLAYSDKYHFNLQKENDAKVRNQGAHINKALKRIRKISSDMPQVMEGTILPPPREEDTHQFITLPPKNKAPDLQLVRVCEEAEEETSSSKPPRRKKVKSWLPW